MPEFLELVPPSEALSLLVRNLDPLAESEEIETAAALGRVTAAPQVAPHPLPSFARSTVDGYAVHASDTYGAGESLPAYLRVQGEVPMGAVPDFALDPGCCALIHTGGMLPGGADAVVMVEYTQAVGGPPDQSWEVEISRAAAPWENVLKVGEDVADGEVVIPAGTRLRPAEIGGLMALGITRLRVARQPKVGVLSSGDEVVPPESTLKPGQVRDVNAYALSALIEQAGGAPVRYGILPDQAEALARVARRALAECDAVVITAGSSASARDLTAQVIDSLGRPGVLVHGVNVRPGKPTILAACAQGGRRKAVIGLPGNPVSALVIAGLFVTPVVAHLLGLRRQAPSATIPARLSLNLPSQAGREDWVAVRLLAEAGGYRAEPVFGKSNLIFTLARADGLVRIPPDATGLEAGQLVGVILL
ncbi:MAG TPA: gephyrin-like molybdotransferase Glp [Anaerolineales bacterium]